MQKSDKKNSTVFQAFTLVEVLLAIAIVGIIAVMVLPTILTHYQDKVFEQAYQKEVNSLNDTIRSLAVMENKSSFKETMMSRESIASDSTKNSAPDSYTTGLFVRKYLNISRNCFANNSGGKGKNACFAKKYTKKVGSKDETITLDNYTGGTCALLRNGMAICITAEDGNNPIQGVLDLNGPKRPNVLNRDFREFRLNHSSTFENQNSIDDTTDTIYD